MAPRKMALASADQRRSRRRRLLGAGVATGGAAWIAACGAGGETSAPSGSAGSKQPAKLLWEIRGGATYEELVREGLKLFNERFPNVQVEFFAKAGAWQEKLISGWSAGDGADVFQAWDDNFWRFAANGVLANVNDLLKDYKKADIDDFVKGQWNGFQIPNTKIRFGMPTYINTGVLYYNKNTFRKAGVKEPDASWTYNEYAESARRLTRSDGGQPAYGVNHPTTGIPRTQNHLWAFGGTYVDPKDFTKTAVHTAASQQAFDWLWDRYWKDKSWLPPKERPAGFNFWTALGTGQIAMAEDGMHALKDVARVEGLEFDIAPIPKGPKQRLSWITTDGWGMWSGSKARSAAWELMKFIASPEWFKLQSRIELLIPSRVSLLDDWIQVLRQRFPTLDKVNLKGVRDGLTASPPEVSTWQQYLCAQEAAQVINPILLELYRDGTSKPTALRDRKDQIDQAAGSCGLSLK